MEQKRPGGEMKVPDPGEPTRSQLLPFEGKFDALSKHGFFVPALATAGLIALLWYFYTHPESKSITEGFHGIPVRVANYLIVFGTFLIAGGMFAFYRIVGKIKPWWVLLGVAAFVAILLAYMPDLIGSLRTLTSCNSFPEDGDLPLRFIQNFACAGIPEELLKAIPVVLGLLIAGKYVGSGMAANFAVTEPLDAVLFGIAAGCGFAFYETLFQYVPKVMMVAGVERVDPRLCGPSGCLDWVINTAQDFLNQGRPDKALELTDKATAGTTARALMLLIPRLVGNVFGHCAYAGTFAYFISLATMRPVNRWKTLAIGLAFAAAMHAAWNTFSSNDFLAFVSCAVSIVVLGSIILKAREISPNRSQLVASQVIDRFSRGQAPSLPVATANAAPSPAPASAVPAQPRSITWDGDPNLLVIEIGTARVPATLGARFYERQAPGTQASRGDGVVAEVTAHPNDATMLGLKNLSNQIWQVTTNKGERRDLAPGRSIRITRGTRIQLGDLVAEVK